MKSLILEPDTGARTLEYLAACLPIPMTEAGTYARANEPHTVFLDQHDRAFARPAAELPRGSLARTFSGLSTYVRAAREGRMAAMDYADLFALAATIHLGWGIPQSQVLCQGAETIFRDHGPESLYESVRRASPTRPPRPIVTVQADFHRLPAANLFRETLCYVTDSLMEGAVCLWEGDEGMALDGVLHRVRLHSPVPSLWEETVFQWGQRHGLQSCDRVVAIPVMDPGDAAVEAMRRRGQHPVGEHIDEPLLGDVGKKVPQIYFLLHDLLTHLTTMGMAPHDERQCFAILADGIRGYPYLSRLKNVEKQARMLTDHTPRHNPFSQELSFYVIKDLRDALIILADNALFELSAGLSPLKQLPLPKQRMGDAFFRYVQTYLKEHLPPHLLTPERQAVIDEICGAWVRFVREKYIQLHRRA